MKEIPFVSVVMPVYNVEMHLEKAVNSILEQTFDDFEIILVDDCSSDKSGEICDKLTLTDNRIRTIHLEKNGGLSNARNTGIEPAQGHYIFFMDSDDYIDKDLFQSVYQSVQKNQADAIIFGLEEDYFDKAGNLSKKYILTYGQELFLNTDESVRAEVIHLEEKTFYGYAWNKFYYLPKLKESGLKFEKITLIEDILFNVHFFNTVHSLNILNIAPYHYMKRIDGSLTNKFIADYFALNKKRVEIVYDQYVAWNCCSQEVKTILANIYARYIFSALQRNYDKRAKLTKADRKRWMKDLFEEEFFNQLLPYMHSGGLLGFLERFLVKKNTSGCLIFGRIIYIVKTKMPILFATAKQGKK